MGWLLPKINITRMDLNFKCLLSRFLNYYLCFNPPIDCVCVCVCVCRFADTEVRSVAVSWIEKSSDDELADYLPQLVQVQL